MSAPTFHEPDGSTGSALHPRQTHAATTEYDPKAASYYYVPPTHGAFFPGYAGAGGGWGVPGDSRGVVSVPPASYTPQYSLDSSAYHAHTHANVHAMPQMQYMPYMAMPWQGQHGGWSLPWVPMPHPSADWPAPHAGLPPKHTTNTPNVENIPQKARNRPRNKLSIVVTEPASLDASNLHTLVDAMDAEHAHSGTKRRRNTTTATPKSCSSTSTLFTHDSLPSMGNYTAARVAFRLSGHLVTDAHPGEEATVAFATARFAGPTAHDNTTDDNFASNSDHPITPRSRGRFGPQAWLPGKSKYSPIYHNDHAWAVAIKSTKVRFKLLAEAEAYYENYCKTLQMDPTKKIRPDFDEDLHGRVLNKLDALRLQAARNLQGAGPSDVELLKLVLPSSVFNEGKCAEKIMDDFLADRLVL